MIARIELGRVQNERNEKARQELYVGKMLGYEPADERTLYAPVKQEPGPEQVLPTVLSAVPPGDSVVAFDDHLSFAEDRVLDEAPFIESYRMDCIAAFGECDGHEVFDVGCESYELMLANPRYGANLLERQATARRIIRHRLAAHIEATRAAKVREAAENVGRATKIGAGAVAIATAIWEFVRSR
ncbi:MAG TPA: hypothetical protein PKW21_14550 [Rhabdaerophilum sp.]|nr:hypothetical protein [Rhabdaerophilum sp.]